MKGKNAENHSNSHREWWGKRPYADYPVSTNKSKINKFFKRQLHKVERKEAGKQIEIQLID